MLSRHSSGSFKNTMDFLRKAQQLDIRKVVEPHAKAGVDALRAATKRDTGLAAESWGYEITQNGSSFVITWTNSDVENGFQVALAIQYGHGTGTGGYVQGVDYINPAMRPIFDKISDDVRKAVSSL